MNARNATYDILWRETFGPDGPERGNSTFYSGWTVADVARTTVPQPGWATREQTWTMGPPGTPGGLRTATDLSHALGVCVHTMVHASSQSSFCFHLAAEQYARAHTCHRWP